MEDVRVCRACGHIDAADRQGRCPECDLYTELAIMPRAEAERLVRRRRRRVRRKRLALLVVLAGLVGAITVWALGVFFDLGPQPPAATTHISASNAPHTWALERRTPLNNGFTPDPAPWPQRLAWTYKTSGRLLAAPAVDEQQVYLATTDGRIVALDQDSGQLLWTYRTSVPSSSTPALADDLVITAVRPGRVLALDRRSGEKQWEADLRQPILASPIVVQGSVYLGTADKKLYALDAATGQQRWAFVTRGWVVSAVAATHDRLLVTSQHSRMHIVSADTGRQRFVYETGLGRQIIAGAVVQGERAYLGSLGGRIWAIDWRQTTYPLERAVLFWQTNLFIWGFLSEPPVQKGSVWSRSVKGDIVHTPALAHNTLYVTTTRGKVVAFDTALGTQRWDANLHVDITAAPTVAGSTLLIGTAKGVVFALDAETGAVLWQFTADGEITASPIVAGERMYVVTDTGTLYALTRSP